MKSTPESRLFGRLVVLVFLLGLVFGLAGLFLGIRISHFIQSGFDPLAPSPSFGWPLDEFQSILDGAFLVLLVTTTDLCSQFLSAPQWKNGRGVFIRFCRHFSMILGFLLMSGGIVSLLEKPLNLPELAINIVLILLFLPGIGALSWYLLVRDKRRVLPREQEEGNVRKSHIVKRL